LSQDGSPTHYQNLALASVDAVSPGNPQLLDRRSAGIATPSAGKLAELLLVLLVFGTVFITHARWILVHFSNDGNLWDAGWLAYLFETGDPLLPNPSAVEPDRLSFYTFHLSPYIYLFGTPLSYLFGLTGIEIFALHQGLFFGLFFISLYLITSMMRPRRRDWAVVAFSAIAIGALSNVLLQAAAFPHYEIALLALASLAVTAWATDHYLVFAFCLVWLPLVREDGGFYAAFACLACLALDYSPGRWRDARIVRLGALALLEIAASFFAIWVKATYFPSTWFTFAYTFSGNSWDHVSTALIVERLLSLIRSPNTLPVLAGSVILAAVDRRYASGFVLLSPLYLLYLLAVTSGPGELTMYYALPWLLPATVWMVVFARRSRAAATTLPESVVLVLLAAALSVPMHRVLGVEREYSYVVKLAFVRPVVSISSLQRFVREARRNHTLDSLDGTSAQSQCVSAGIAALVPNDVQPDEVIYADGNLDKCRSVFLLRGGSQDGPVRAQAEAHGFKPIATRYNASLWVRDVN
jgi:hypothetical protein